MNSPGLFGKLRPYFHKVGVPAIDGVCSTDVLVIAPRAPHWRGVLLAHVSSDAMIAHADASSTGTKMPRTSWANIARFPIVIPTSDVAQVATHFVSAQLNRMHSLVIESRDLSLTRDTLLPHLIAGTLTDRTNGTA